MTFKSHLLQVAESMREYAGTLDVRDISATLVVKTSPTSKYPGDPNGLSDAVVTYTAIKHNTQNPYIRMISNGKTFGSDQTEGSSYVMTLTRKQDNFGLDFFNCPENSEISVVLSSPRFIHDIVTKISDVQTTSSKTTVLLKSVGAKL